jgi:hypothetical protein
MAPVRLGEARDARASGVGRTRHTAAGLAASLALLPRSGRAVPVERAPMASVRLRQFRPVTCHAKKNGPLAAGSRLGAVCSQS